jgi:branched-chain amino acid transport system substrate-binding protein
MGETMLSRRDAMQGLAAIGSAAGMTPAMSIWSEALGNEEIAVASLLDANGPINIYGRPMIDATAFAVDHINSSGGVLGKKLRLIQLDTQSDNNIYAQYALQVMLKNRVSVLVGGITSASREAMRPVVDKYKQIFFYNEQYEGGVCDKYVFCTGVTPAQQLGLLVPWSLETYGKTFYTLAADYNYGHISADWVKKYLRQAGGELVGEEFIPLDVVNFDSVIQRVEQKKPAVVMSLLVGGNHIAFYRQFAAAGLKGKIPMVSTTFGLGNEQVVLDPTEAEDIAVIYPYFQEIDTPVNKAWVEAWRKRFGADYTYITDSANSSWNGWHLWAKGVNKAGSLDTGKVIAALESGVTFEAPEGMISLDPQSHHVVHSVHLAKANRKHGFDIIRSWSNVPPSDTMAVCNLLKHPDTHMQFTPLARPSDASGRQGAWAGSRKNPA